MKSSSIFLRLLCFSCQFLVTGPSFMSISWLVLELWKLLFITDRPEIRNLEIPTSVFCPISGDWGKLHIPNFAQMYPIMFLWMLLLMLMLLMLQNARVTAFTISKLLRKNQRRGVKLPPTQIRVKIAPFQKINFQDCSLTKYFFKIAPSKKTFLKLLPQKIHFFKLLFQKHSFKEDIFKKYIFKIAFSKKY